MTEFNRTSTLSLRHADSALTGSRQTKPAAPAVPRKSANEAKPANTPAAGERKLDSTALLQGRTQMSIVHNGETYQLRATRLGKLILTK